MRKTHFIFILSAFVMAACGGDEPQYQHEHPDGGHDHADASGPPLANTLLVAREGSLVSFDIATGEERPGTVLNVDGPVDMQALHNGFIMVNLSSRNELLVVDSRTMLEEARLPSSAAAAVRPVHGYVSPELAGKRYWLALNDGQGTQPETNSARLIDIAPASATYLQPAGEFALGIGHHKASFSATLPRVAISSMNDCDNVITVYDFSDPANVQSLATLTAEAAGWDGSSFARTCDITYQTGVPPAPHGCATSVSSGKSYCNLTGSGEIAVIDIDAETPTFQILPTDGSGGGYTEVHPFNRYAYTVQGEPREVYDDVSGTTERACQIGVLSVIDTMNDAVAATLPLRYTGPDCTDALIGTPAESANPGHTYFAYDGRTVYIPVSGGYGAADARVDQVLVIDTRNAAAPVQLPSLKVGVHTGHAAATISGDGDSLFVVGAVDGTVTRIDVDTQTVVETLTVGENPRVVATFGTVEGPSHRIGPVVHEEHQDPSHSH